MLHVVNIIIIKKIGNCPVQGHVKAKKKLQIISYKENEVQLQLIYTNEK